MGIRPGSQSPEAGLRQVISVVAGNSYSWSVDVGVTDVQNATGFSVGTFEVRLNGVVVATATYADGAARSGELLRDLYPSERIRAVRSRLQPRGQQLHCASAVVDRRRSFLNHAVAITTPLHDAI